MKRLLLAVSIAAAVLLFALPCCLRATQQATGEQYEDTQPPSVPQVGEIFKEANRWLSQNHLAINKAPETVLTSGYLLVDAEGLPSATARTMTEKRLSAERAAAVIAYRKLAEFLSGVPVVGDTYVRDQRPHYDVMRTTVAGFVKGAQMVYKEFNEKEEFALVIMKIGAAGPAGFTGALYEKIMGSPELKRAVLEERPDYRPKPAALVEVFDSLIVDATSETFRPALFNRIFTVKGEPLYDPSKIDQKVLVEQGCGDYTNTIQRAKEALSLRGATNPLIIKATGTSSPTDLTVSEDDAVKIFSASQKAAFLSQAKVAFVLK